MAKGAVAKTEVFNKILKLFNGAFAYNGGKELRIPMVENGEEVQIKVTLTCAKDNVVPGEDTALPGTTVQPKSSNESYHFGNTLSATVSEQKEVVPTVEPTEEEKANVKSLLAVLGL